MKEGSIPRPRPAAHVWRAAAATVRAFVAGTNAEQIARDLWPDDPVTPIVLRASSTQAVTTDPSWAGPIARLSVSEAIQESVAMSAVGNLLLGALRVDLGRNATVRVPGRLTSAADAGGFVGEGANVPVRQLSILAGPALTTRKLECIVTMTRELTEASNIEDVVRVLLTEAAGLSLDAAVFSANPGTAAQAAGLLDGIAPLGATSGLTLYEACGRDLGVLVQDLASRAGGQAAVFVAAPAQAIEMRFFAGGQFGRTPGQDVVPVAASAALADHTVVAIEPSSLAISLSDPTFTASKVATLQMDSPPDPSGVLLPATSVKSMLQIDAIALKMTMWADWGMRAPHVAWMEGTSW